VRRRQPSASADWTGDRRGYTVTGERDMSEPHDRRLANTHRGDTVIAVSVIFQYDEDFDRGRVISIAENARHSFEGMPGLRSKAFTVDDARRRAMNFYVWESADAAKKFFSDEMRERVTGLYGVEPTIEFVEIAQLVDNSGASPRD
jgi:heme-degrading monooxygenase HmoA